MVVLFKPTLKCNMSCRHCYVGKRRQEQAVMELESARELIGKLPAGSEVIFHGGEPTLLPVEYYEQATRDFLHTHRFSMQSNLAAVDAKWVPFFRERLEGRVSTSYDIMSLVRNVNKSDWIEKITLLRKSGIYPYVVSILSAFNEDIGQDIYSYFNNSRLSFRLNPLMNLGSARDGFWSLRHNHGKYAEAVTVIFDMWFMNKDSKIIFDPGAEILSFVIAGASTGKCPFTAKCAGYLMCVEPNGDIYPCAGFDEEGSFCYGNLHRSGMDDILASGKRLSAMKRPSHLPPECHICEYYTLCGGGCRLEAYSYYGNIYAKTSLCDDYRRIFSHILHRVDKERGDMMDWLCSIKPEVAGILPYR